MNTNQKIEQALSDLVDGNIWPLICPLEQKPDTFIVYDPVIEKPDDFGDDYEGEWIQRLEINWFSRPKTGSKKPVNYLAAKKQMKERLQEAGFTVTNIIPGYESDTGYTTCIITCEIAEE